ncbi:uncharacterized protein K489DRAFT_433641 [Dissoconium aciculare CBS 342.82]|uniref:Uncharacterized protein n=1 Tax=Dissoconium aciculare CBS 342.82 TaxID=1314786 RepID=A0A6J3LZY6_9PEZI|nr:uncharacterized protein K489DRAFT_433641 [Dissoconium aciculare CBS 342.82]KAF1820202.1 hypothetical protein K489DRAFT_433641 [Dissoconium aciculare CBS 342.82]
MFANDIEMRGTPSPYTKVVAHIWCPVGTLNSSQSVIWVDVERCVADSNEVWVSIQQLRTDLAEEFPTLWPFYFRGGMPWKIRLQNTLDDAIKYLTNENGSFNIPIDIFLLNNRAANSIPPEYQNLSRFAESTSVKIPRQIAEQDEEPPAKKKKLIEFVTEPTPGDIMFCESPPSSDTAQSSPNNAQTKSARA